MSGYLKAKINRSSRKLTALDQHVWERSDQCYARSRRNMWGLLVFLLISIDAYSFRAFDLFAAASEPLRQLLGYPPPAALISLALAVYCFAAILLTFTSMARDIRPTPGWKHVGYRAVFYLFYSFSGALADHYLAVLLTGLCLFSLDQCHIWFYNAKAVQQHKQLLG